jgi:hypothetical protein
MAAGQGFKTFVTGEVLTAADTNGYLMQGTWVFANAAARDAAVTSPQEGNMCYLKDTDAVQYYSGSAWTAVSAASSFVGCSLYKSADQSLANVTTTVVTWDLEHYDTNTFHDNVLNNTRITIPAGKAGKYLIQVTLNWNSNATSYREARIRLNGSTLLAYSPIQAAASGGVANTLNVVKNLAAADYIEIQGEQASGGALSISGGNTYSAQVQVTYMGA